MPSLRLINKRQYSWFYCHRCFFSKFIMIIHNNVQMIIVCPWPIIASWLMFHEEGTTTHLHRGTFYKNKAWLLSAYTISYPWCMPCQNLLRFSIKYSALFQWIFCGIWQFTFFTLTPIHKTYLLSIKTLILLYANMFQVTNELFLWQPRIQNLMKLQ